ncbi:hypothetical protein E4U31_003406 [Claviceps sp. LM219 group G6]|nr:hypothetical protein E4U31_003406 [Claviceps sp. LM219 group G6]
MAPATRVSAKATEAPESQTTPGQGVPSQVADSISTVPKPSTNALADLQCQLEMAELTERAAPMPKAPSANAADTTGDS